MEALAGQQVAAGHTVGVAAVLDEKAPEPPVLLGLRNRGSSVHTLRPPARAYRKEQALVGQVCDRLDPDIVHTHGYRADVLHGRVARDRGLPVVATVHGFTGGDWKNRFYEWLQRRAYRRYDAVVAVSQPLRAELADAGISSERLHCIPNAWVDDTDFLDRPEARDRLGLDPGGSWVGFVGRLGREKGADVFVDAFDHIDAGNGVMIGSGRLREKLERRAQARLGGVRIRFAGMVPDAGRLMKALDVFVLSSRTEGTPIALLEAMAAGVPVVATRVGGVPHVVSEDEALLVESERPRELAGAIAAVLADSEGARARAERARNRLLAELDPQRWIARYDRVYAEATAANEVEV